jgi:hypothetical protein
MGVGLSTASAADGKGAAVDSPSAETSAGTNQSWLPNWFSSKDKPPAKPEKPASARADAAGKKEKGKEEDANSGRDAASPTSAERAKYLRRLKVCDKLRSIAQDANDAELERMVDQLEERAFAVFLQKTGVPGGGSSFESDEKVLEKRLPLGTAATKPQPTGTASAQNNPGQSGRIREN